MAPADAARPPGVTLAVEVVLGLAPRQCLRLPLQLSAPACVGDALRAADLARHLDATTLDAMTVGLWGRACALDAPLHDGDRIELTRGLLVDPKEARRQRFRRDGVRRRVQAVPRVRTD